MEMPQDEKSLLNWYRVELESVITGKKLDLRVQLGLGIVLRSEFELRNLSIEEGKEQVSKEYLQSLLSHRKLMIRTYPILGLFGYELDLWVKKEEEAGGDWLLVNNLLVEQGYAKK